MKQILLIDDDIELCSLLTDYLRAEGFEVEAVHNGEAGLQRALAGNYSIVVLDVMLPGISGLDVLRRLRPQSRVPVLLLTARGEDVDRIVGLELGADDYVPKPFNTRELLARVQAILRRVQGGQSPGQMVAVGDVTLDPGARTVHRNGQKVEFTSVEFDLLRYLLENAGNVVPREELAERVLGRRFSPFDRSIDMHISKIRRKLLDESDELIKTVRGTGYIYARPVLAGERAGSK
ncbi:MAG TPA: response regulator transcription factor [Candidatus Koribacter sp.]|jgi:two-component system response regulator CpxR